LRRHEPALWQRTRWLLSGTGYIVYRLTGLPSLDVYDAGLYAPLFDPQTLDWNPDLADLLAPASRLPPITWSCTIAGRVTQAAAQVTGLAAGTPVITGMADAAAEALSAGLAQVGDMMVMYGSSIFFILKTDRLHQSRRFWPARFLEPQSYVVAGGMSTAGSLTRWFRDQLAAPEWQAEQAGSPNAYAALAALAATSPPGARGLIALPYFAGERTPLHDADARGVFFGLTLSHTRGDLYRALLEEVGYGIRHNLDALCEEGMVGQRILAVGGGVHNPLWMEMVSTIAGIEQHLPAQTMGAAYGDAMLAAVGVGFFPDTTSATQWVQSTQVIQPQPAHQPYYDRLYILYRQLYPQTADLMHQLSHLQRSDP
jgi:xylulokinase